MCTQRPMQPVIFTPPLPFPSQPSNMPLWLQRDALNLNDCYLIIPLTEVAVEQMSTGHRDLECYKQTSKTDRGNVNFSTLPASRLIQWTWQLIKCFIFAHLLIHKSLPHQLALICFFSPLSFLFMLSSLQKALYSSHLHYPENLLWSCEIL